MIKNIIKYSTFVLCSIIIIFLLHIQPVDARDTLKDTWTIANGVAGEAGYETGEDVTVQKFIGQVITVLLSFLGVIFIVLLVYGGYLWMTDRGNEEQVKRAKNLITASVIGLIIIVLAYAISQFVLDRLTSDLLKDTAE